MKQIFMLSKKDLSLSKEEVIRLYHAKKYELTDNLLIMGSDKDYSSRLAYTNEVYDYLFECKKTGLEKKVSGFGWNKFYKKSFSVRIIGDNGKSERKIGGIIYDTLKNPKVDLENAKTKIVFFNTKDKVICGILKHVVGKSFLQRKAHLRPELHPTSLHPQLARACINLTGKTKGRLLDPFCGSGGILIEAGLMGFSVAGFDIDRIMVKRAKINLDYYSVKDYRLKVFDATEISERFDCIVTDLPYGKSSKISEELTALYRKFLKKAYCCTDSAVVLFPDFADYKTLLGRWKVKEEFTYYLHKSLSKKIVLLEK